MRSQWLMVVIVPCKVVVQWLMGVAKLLRPRPNMFLYNSNQSIVCYIVKSFILCATVAISISLVLDYVYTLPNDSPSKNITFYDVLGASFVSPIIETLIIFILISILGLFIESRSLKAIMVAIFMSYLHGLAFPFWGVVTFFSFFVFSISYLVWSELKIWLGLVSSASIHFLLNFFSSIFVYIGQFYYV